MERTAGHPSLHEGGLEIVNTINYLKPLKRVNKPGKAVSL